LRGARPSRHREEDARLAVHDRQHDARDRDERPDRDQRGAPLDPRPVPQRRGQRGLGVSELVGRERADGDDGDEDVEERRDAERGENRDRQVAPGVLRLLTRGRDRVKADVGEEDDRRRRHDAADALLLAAVERREVVAVERGHADHDEHQERGDLDEHHHAVGTRALAHAVDEQRHDREHDEDGRQVDRAALAGRAGDPLGQRIAEHRVEEDVEVLAPADRDGDDRHAVFEDQVPADDPPGQLAHGGVRVRVGAARDRDARRELGAAERRERARDAGQDEREDDQRARGRDRLADHDEDAGADDRAQAERRQVAETDHALE
jgi:hypothetical protein